MRFLLLDRMEWLALLLGVGLALTALSAHAMGQPAPHGSWVCNAYASCENLNPPNPNPGDPGGHNPGPSITGCSFQSDPHSSRADAQQDALSQCRSDGSVIGSCKLQGCQQF